MACLMCESKPATRSDRLCDDCGKLKDAMNKPQSPPAPKPKPGKK